MANIKISDLTQAGSVSDAQEFEINNSGVSNKVTASQIEAYLKSAFLTSDITDLTATNTELNNLANGSFTGAFDVDGTLTVSRGVGDTDTDTTNTGAVTLDFSANQNFVLTLTGNVTLANPTTEQVGQSGFIVFIQDATGGRTVSLGTDYETAGGAGLSLSSAASATDIVPYVVAASGRILLGAPQLAFS